MMTGYGVRSSMLVAYTQNFWLGVINCSALAAAALYLTTAAVGRYTSQEINSTMSSMGTTVTSPAVTPAGTPRSLPLHCAPVSLQTADLNSGAITIGSSLTGHHCWPSYPTLLTILQCEEKRRWIETVKVTRQLELTWRSSDPLLLPLHELEREMARVRHQWARAKAQDSLLEHALRESIETLVALHEEFRYVALLFLLFVVVT
jgi:hypothetical protein